MEIKTETLSNGNTITYQIVNGTAYHAETSRSVIDVLELARINRTRVRLFMGDIETGKGWVEEHNVVGYIGRSSGDIKIPILVYNERSYGGVGILDHCILKIREAKGNSVLYQASNYQHPLFDIKESENKDYSVSLWVNNELYANLKSNSEAEKLIKKLS